MNSALILLYFQTVRLDKDLHTGHFRPTSAALRLRPGPCPLGDSNAASRGAYLARYSYHQLQGSQSGDLCLLGADKEAVFQSSEPGPAWLIR